MNERPVRFTDSQVAHILKRAAEIDARGDTMSAGDLSAIAAEAGIDPRATDAAIRELLAEEEGGALTPPEPGSAVAEQNARVPARRTALSLPWRVAAGGAVGAACGFIYGLSAGVMIDPFLPPTARVTIGALIGLGTATLYLIARGVPSMKRGDQRSFQIENLAVWIGAALGTIPSSSRFSTWTTSWPRCSSRGSSSRWSGGCWCGSARKGWASRTNRQGSGPGRLKPSRAAPGDAAFRAKAGRSWLIYRFAIYRLIP